MKSIPSSLAAHIAGELTNLAWLLRITRRDGTVLGFTTFDADLVVDDVTYLAGDSFFSSDLETPSGLAPANSDIMGLLDTSAISDADIAAGYYDDAAVALLACDWSNTDGGALTMRTGSIGNIAHDGIQYRFEIKGMLDVLSQTINAAFTKTCRHRFGDAGCTIDAALFTVTGSITHVTNNLIFTDSTRTQPDGYYTYGHITFTGGANTDLQFDIRDFTSGVFTLWQELPNAPQAGDTYRLVVGCDKQFATCQTKFTNSLNFGGFPHIPGADAILQTPDAKIG